MKLCLATVLLLLLGAASGFAINREAFTFTDYVLEIRIEPQQQRLAGRGTIRLRNDSPSPQKNVVLQISSGLDWRSVQMSGRSVQFVSQSYASDVDHTGSLSEAIVSLPQAIAPQGTVELEIGYEGVIQADVTRLTRIGVPAKDAAHSDWDQIGKSFSAVRGIGNVVWYPVATESATLSDGNSVFEAVGRWRQREALSQMMLTMCLPEESAQVLVMNDPGSGSETQPFCTQHRFQPLGNVVPSFTIGDYSKVDRPAGSIFYLPGQRPRADDYALAADAVAPLVTEWFGTAKQPGKVVALADDDASPFESGGTLFAPLRAFTDSRQAQLTAVHQLTHAAFPSSRQWIYEGAAHFAQALYREQQGGRGAATEYLQSHAAGLADAEKASVADASQATSNSLVSTAEETFYRSKAMYVWWMLRDLVGDPALEKALQQYRPEKDTEPSYVQRLVQAQTQRDLEWFFDDWVYRDHGLPDFRVETATLRPTVGGGFVVTVTVINTGSAGAEIPVRAVTAEGEVSHRLLVPGKGKAVIRLETPSTPQRIEINDGSVPESDTSNNLYKIDASAVPGN